MKAGDMRPLDARRPLALPLTLMLVGLFMVGCGAAVTSPASPTGSNPGTAQPGQTAIPAEVNPSGDIPDTQAYVGFDLPSGGASVTIPEGWARAQTGDAFIFSSHYNSVRFETVRTANAPTVTSAGTSEAPVIQQQGGAFALGAITLVPRTAGPAILITYQVNSGADPVTGRQVRLAVERYEFWRNGIEAVLTLSAPAGADNVDPWRTITNSFHWL